MKRNLFEGNEIKQSNVFTERSIPQKDDGYFANLELSSDPNGQTEPLDSNSIGCPLEIKPKNKRESIYGEHVITNQRGDKRLDQD